MIAVDRHVRVQTQIPFATNQRLATARLYTTPVGSAEHRIWSRNAPPAGCARSARPRSASTKIRAATKKVGKAQQAQEKAARAARARTKTQLKDEFGKKVKGLLAESTNIFRWCASPEIQKCHVGDSRNIDRVIWVTQAADFNTLAAKGLNVVLQLPDPLKARVGGDSATNLSTLFVNVEDIKKSPARSINIATAPRGARINTCSSQKRRVAQATETQKGFDFLKKVLEPLGLYCCKATDAEIKNEGIRKPLGVKEKLPVESEPEAEVEATE